MKPFFKYYYLETFKQFRVNWITLFLDQLTSTLLNEIFFSSWLRKIVHIELDIPPEK